MRLELYWLLRHLCLNLELFHKRKGRINRLPYTEIPIPLKVAGSSQGCFYSNRLTISFFFFFFFYILEAINVTWNVKIVIYDPRRTRLFSSVTVGTRQTRIVQLLLLEGRNYEKKYTCSTRPSKLSFVINLEKKNWRFSMEEENMVSWNSGIDHS